VEKNVTKRNQYVFSKKRGGEGWQTRGHTHLKKILEDRQTQPGRNHPALIHHSTEAEQGFGGPHHGEKGKNAKTLRDNKHGGSQNEL